MLAMVDYFTSCYDDKSNDSIKTINPLVIDMKYPPRCQSLFVALEIKTGRLQDRFG